MQKNSREKKALASAALQLLIQTVRWLQPIVGALWSRQLVRFLVYMVTIHTQQVSNSSIDHLLEYSCNAGSIRCNLSCKLACVARFPANSLSPSSACSSNVQQKRPQIKHQWCWSNKYIHRRSENSRDQQQWSDWRVFWKNIHNPQCFTILRWQHLITRVTFFAFANSRWSIRLKTMRVKLNWGENKTWFETTTYSTKWISLSVYLSLSLSDSACVSPHFLSCQVNCFRAASEPVSNFGASCWAPS